MAASATEEDRAGPFPPALLRSLAGRYGTPLYVYSAETILARVEALRGGSPSARRGFDVVRYAQKANPNLAILRLLLSDKVELDAVSAGELERALRAGARPDRVLFCSDVFDRAALELVRRHPFQVACGSADMLAQLAGARPESAVILRLNPGFGSGHHAKVTTGGESSKHGIWHAELPAAIERARALSLRVRGLHVHVGSGSDLEGLTGACEAVVAAARAVGPSLEMVSCGGGLPVPYRSGEAPFDPAPLAAAWNRARETIERELSRSIALEVEPGRFLVAESGLLLAEVRALKRQGDVAYALVDAGFHNLIRPALYGAFHGIEPVEPRAGERRPVVVAGPLCESADVFTQSRGGTLEPRMLPPLEVGDLVCIRDAGAYGASMASTYNSQPLAAEVLVRGGEARLVRRRQTVAEMLAPELGLEPEARSEGATPRAGSR